MTDIIITELVDYRSTIQLTYEDGGGIIPSTGASVSGAVYTSLDSSEVILSFTASVSPTLSGGYDIVSPAVNNSFPCLCGPAPKQKLGVYQVVARIPALNNDLIKIGSGDVYVLKSPNDRCG